MLAMLAQLALIAQQALSRGCISSLANFQDIASALTTPSPSPDIHRMRPTDSNGDKRIRKDTQTDEDRIVDENCIFCGEEPKAGHVHLQLLHNVQVFKSNISIELNNNNKLTGDIHTLTVFYFPQTFQVLEKGLLQGLNRNSKLEKEVEDSKRTTGKLQGKLQENKEQGKLQGKL